MTIENLVARVEHKRKARKLSQRALAREVGMSQGHLSKLLRSKAPIGTRGRRELEAWLNDERSSGPDPRVLSDALLEACVRATAGGDAAMHLVTELMHVVARLRTTAAVDAADGHRRRR